MKNIDIITSHNVTIEYQLASVMERFLAFLIDAAIISGYWLFVFIIATAFSSNDAYSVYMTLFMPVLLFYHLISEAFFGGQSLGKLAMGVKVVRLNGQSPQMSECLLRWIFRTVDLGGTLGMFAALFASASDKGQRLGDVIARTVVIKLNPAHRFTINDIMNIKSASTHGEVKYPGVTRFTDEDMLLIKNSIERYKLYSNESHKKLILELTSIVSEKLSIETPQRDQIGFLREVLDEYIVLTR